jgi:hypothetical protein
MPGNFGVGRNAGVGKLGDDTTALFVDSIRHPTKPINKGVIIDTQLTVPRLTVLSHKGMTRNHEAHTPLSESGHQFDELL